MMIISEGKLLTATEITATLGLFGAIYTPPEDTTALISTITLYNEGAKTTVTLFVSSAIIFKEELDTGQYRVFDIPLVVESNLNISGTVSSNGDAVNCLIFGIEEVFDENDKMIPRSFYVASSVPTIPEGGGPSSVGDFEAHLYKTIIFHNNNGSNDNTFNFAIGVETSTLWKRTLAPGETFYITAPYLTRTPASGSSGSPRIRVSHSAMNCVICGLELNL